MTDVTREANDDETEELLEFSSVIAYAFCGWWCLAGGLSLYWATGGTVGLWTLWGGNEHLSGAREPVLGSLLWVIGVVELALVLPSLSIARHFRGFGLLALVNASAFLLGLTLVPYVAVETLVNGLVSFGVVGSSFEDLTGVVWRLLFWNPWWVIGALLYCGGAWLSQYASADGANSARSSSKG